MSNIQSPNLVNVSHSHHEQGGLQRHAWLVMCGLCMGAADVVPGVSGGTMAFVLGIYEEWLQAIRAVNMTFLSRVLRLQWRAALEDFPWRFLVALGSGIGVAIFSLAKGLSWALQQYPTLVWGFFFGLVLASVVVVYKRVSSWTLRLILITVVAAAGSYGLVGLTPAVTPTTSWFLFLCGVIAICAMVLPGISGAFMLVLLGKYQYVLTAVEQRDLLPLLIVAGGGVIGLATMARVLLWAFRHYHDVMIAALTGLMLGSLRKVWPWKEVLMTMPGRHGDVIAVAERNMLPTSLTAEVGLVCLLGLVAFGLVVTLESVATWRASRRVA